MEFSERQGSGVPEAPTRHACQRPGSGVPEAPTRHSCERRNLRVGVAWLRKLRAPDVTTVLVSRILPLVAKIPAFAGMTGLGRYLRGSGMTGLRLSLCLFFHFSLFTIHSSLSAQPNVLFIISDDLNNAQSTYGWRQVQTPHLDKLASEGMQFNRAYCQGTECTSSRTSMSIGMYPNKTGNGVPNYLNSNAEATTFPAFFRANGYYSGRAGKFFHQGVPRALCDGDRGPEDSDAWDDLYDPFDSKDCQEWENRINASSNCTHQGSCLSWLSVESEDSEHSDGMVATRVISMLQERSQASEPWFISAGFYRPHVPFIAPPKYFDMYPVDEIILPPDVPNDIDDVPGAARIHTEMTYIDDEIQRQAIQGYYATISLMDAQVGRILAALDSLGMTDNTIIVFTSDHGYSLGEHEQWVKPSVFEEGARVPLLIKAPGMGGVGRQSESFVELIDIFPTLADYAGLEAPGYLTGRSLRPVLDNHLVPMRPYAVTFKTSNGISIRNHEWRYSQYGSGGTWGRDGNNGKELYDHINDSLEYDNKAGDGAFSEDEAAMTQIADNYDDVDYVTPYPGCMDEAYEEYNPSAQTEDNSLCQTIVVGVLQEQPMTYRMSITESQITFRFTEKIPTGTPLTVYNLQGRKMVELLTEDPYILTWKFPTGYRGVYLVRLGNKQNTQPLKVPI